MTDEELIKQLQLELDNERQYHVNTEYLWGLDRELLSNLKARTENAEAKLAQAVDELVWVASMLEKYLPHPNYTALVDYIRIAVDELGENT